MNSVSRIVQLVCQREDHNLCETRAAPVACDIQTLGIHCVPRVAVGRGGGASSVSAPMLPHFDDPQKMLSELARLGARLIIQRAVEDEFDTWLGRARYERRPERISPLFLAHSGDVLDQRRELARAQAALSRVSVDFSHVAQKRRWSGPEAAGVLPNAAAKFGVGASRVSRAVAKQDDEAPVTS